MFEFSMPCQACLDAREGMNELGLSDDEGRARDAAFADAVERFLDSCTSLPARQRLSELNIVWQLDVWDGDTRTGETATSEAIERMISTTIEEFCA